LISGLLLECCVDLHFCLFSYWITWLGTNFTRQVAKGC
jgi:hypothetical protein